MTKVSAPAAVRNREPIREVLARYLATPSTRVVSHASSQSVDDNALPVLEIASGSGEHAVHMAQAFPTVRWQPTDPDAHALTSIAAWHAEVELPNLLPPKQLDATSSAWPVVAARMVVCINMIHIAPWEATLGLFAGAARTLPPHHHLFLYGPYRLFGVFNAPSNRDFDSSLRTRDPRWGIRDLAELGPVAVEHGFVLEELVAMPANNHCLIWRRL